MNKWDIDDVRTWKGCPYRYDMRFFTFFTPREYAEYSKRCWESDLEERRYAEAMIRGDLPIDGVAMEHLFQTLAKALHVPEQRMSFHGRANWFDWELGQKGKTLMYGVIGDLLCLKRRVSPWISAWIKLADFKRQERRVNRS